MCQDAQMKAAAYFTIHTYQPEVQIILLFKDAVKVCGLSLTIVSKHEFASVIQFKLIQIERDL